MSDVLDDDLLEELEKPEPGSRAHEGFAVPMDRVEMRRRTKAITAMLQVFLKAGKTLRLYSEDHHFFEMFVGQFEDRLREQLVARDNLTIEVTPRAMIWDGNVVLQADEGRRESLAWRLHRDGVRLLQFIPGIERKEIREFVALLARETDPSTSSGSELSLLFWEADFKHIRLAIAESFVEYTEEAERILAEVAEDLERLRERFGISGRPRNLGSYRPHARKGMDDVRRVREVRTTHGALTGLGGIGGSEAGGGYGGRRGDMTSDVGRRGYVGTILVDEETELPDVPVEVFDDNAMVRLYEDLHGLENVNAGFDEVGAILGEVVLAESKEDELLVFLQHLEEALTPLLATGSMSQVNAVLRPLALIHHQQKSVSTFRAPLLRSFFARVGHSDRLGPLAESLNAVWRDELKGELFTFVSVQDADDLDPLFDLLKQLQDEAARDVVTDAILLLSRRDPVIFLDRLHSRNVREVGAALRALSKIGDPMFMSHVAGAYTRPEVEVRTKVLQVLRTDRSPRVVGLMQDALSDSEKSVRLEALRYIASHRVQAARPVMAEEMRRKDFHGRTFDERRGWYIALGRLGGKDALEALVGQIEAHKDDRGDEAKEIVHLALLGVKATRTREGQVYLEGFAEIARGQLRSIIRQILAPAGGDARVRPSDSMRQGGSR